MTVDQIFTAIRKFGHFDCFTGLIEFPSVSTHSARKNTMVVMKTASSVGHSGQKVKKSKLAHASEKTFPAFLIMKYQALS